MSDVTLLADEKRLRLDPTKYEMECRQYAERVYRTLVALEPLYEAPEAIEWLISEQSPLHGCRPVSLLRTPGGIAQVEAKIALVLNGAYS